MVPVCRALQVGGIQAAYAAYSGLKDNQEYFYDGDELVTVVYQMMSVGRIDLAIDLLRLNLQVFPKHVGSYLLLAKLYVKKGDPAQAQIALQDAHAVVPDSLRVTELLARVGKGL